jgi:phosphoribosylformylglycinamidine synthase
VPDTVALPGVDEAVALGLTAAEYELIVEKLGRPPNQVELAMFSLLWSEHCAYKHSRKLLRRLPTEGEHVLMGPGENAGAVDVGGGLACAFKVESHNHPSAVEPFQGAATGRRRDPARRVRGRRAARRRARLAALRGAGVREDPLPPRPRRRGHRPLRQLDWRADGRRRGLLRGALRGQLPGQRDVPRPGRARAADSERRRRSGQRRRAHGSLDRPDGIGGASVLASAELDEEDESKRPSVQIGDPFEESKLVELCLELLEAELLVRSRTSAPPG